MKTCLKPTLSSNARWALMPVFVLCLMSVWSHAQTVSRVQGNLCVGSKNTFAFNGNCNNVTWQVAPSGMYTIISQSNAMLEVKWNSATSSARVTAIYSSCSPTASGGTSTPNMNITGSLTPSVSISVDGGSSTICTGGSLNFTASAVHGGSSPTYRWYINNVMKQSGNGSSARFFTWSSFNNGDAVKCSIISVASGCLTSVSATSNTISVTVNQPNAPNITIHSYGLPVCVGQTNAGFQLSGSPLNGTYKWYRNNSLVTDNTPTVPSFVYQPTVPLNNGDLVKLVFTPSGSCATTVTSNTITATTRQSVQPTVSVSTSLNLPATICAGTNITFTAGPGASGYTLSNYQWTLDGTPVSGNSSNTFSTTSYNQGSVVTVRATASGSCLSSTSTTTHTTQGYPITVVPVVTPGVSLSPTTVNQCAGTSVTFTATPSNGGNNPGYTWLLNGATAPGSTNSSTYTTSALKSGDVVKVILTSNAQCLAGAATAERSTSSITMTPYTSFNLSINDPGPFCAGKNNSFNATALDGGNGTYRWYLTRDGVERQVPNNERDMSSGYDYIFTPHPNFPLRNNDVIKCTFTSNRQCVTTNPVVSNSRTVVVTNPVDPKITVSVTSHDLPATICAGTNITFRAGPGASGYSLSNYQWTLDGNPITGNTSNTFSTTSYNQGSIVTVRATASGSCISSTSTDTHTTEGYPIAILPVVTPSVSLSPTTVNQCAGSTITFTATPSNGGTNPTYAWLVNGATAPGSTSSNTYTTSSLTTGDVVKVIMTSNAQCLAGSATSERSTTSITINSYTSFNLSINNPGPFCDGKNNSYHATPLDAGNGTYRWYVTRGGVERQVPDNERDMSSGYGYIFTPHEDFPLRNNDVLKCTFTSNRQCVTTNPVISNSRTVAVTNSIDPKITIDVISHDLPVTVCAGETFTFKAAPPPNALYTLSGYQWTLDGEQITNNNTNTFSTSSFTNESIVTVTASSANGGCITNNPVPTVTTEGSPMSVVPHFVANIVPSGTKKLASWASQTIIASPVGPEYSYEWYKDGSVIPDETSSTYTASDEGEYTVIISRSTCEKTSPVFFLDKNNPPVANAGPDVILDYPTRYVTLQGSASDSDGTIVSYAWTKVSGPDRFRMVNSESASLYLNDLAFGTYVFRLTATDNDEDSGSDEVTIVVTAPPNNYNLIKETTVFVPEKAIGGLAALEIGNGEKSENWRYFDGIGRPMQNIVRQGSPAKFDIVQPVIYDPFGREAKRYLPFTSQNNGWYNPTNEIIHPDTEDYIGVASNFYNNPSAKIADDNNKPFSKTIFEPSPLNRVIKEGAPGAAWQPDDVNTYASTDHSIKKSYETNTGMEVLRWTYTYPTSTYPLGLVNAGTTSSPQYYAARELYKNKTKDEQNHEVIEYIDKEGRIVLKRVQAVESPSSINDINYASTYYIYDDFDNVVCVIPPEAVSRLSTEYYHSGASDDSKADFLKRWAFRYKYDAQQRMVIKQVPGAEPVYMVYDDRDRIVLTQDGNQRKTDTNGNVTGTEWTFTKYDALNRPVITGIYDHGAVVDQGVMQVHINSRFTSGDTYYEMYDGSAGTGYTNSAFPTLGTTVLTITYYDNYDFKALIAGNSDEYTPGDLDGQEPAEWPLVNGQVTGTQVSVLGSTTFLWTVNYYDKKYRLIQTKSLNTFGDVDRTTNVYDFGGKVIGTSTRHVRGTNVQLVKKRFAYDHMGRLMKTWHKVNSEPEVLLNENSYNELGELVVKKLHSVGGTGFKQHVDYRYNIRGWLTRINNSDLNTTNDIGPKDYFGMEFGYNNGLDIGSFTPQYTGNISSVKWSSNLGLPSPDKPDQRAYRFSYDPMNRLLEANHATKSGVWTSSSAYLETIEYDLNGNIRRLNRNDENGSPIDRLTFDYDIGKNQLLFVTDNGIASKGFKDGNLGNDFAFDANGNMINDRNKGIERIHFNSYLNLTEEIAKDNGERIKYIYNANGIKLRQEVYPPGAEIPSKYTEFIGPFVYEDDTLKFIHHDEGKILAPKPQDDDQSLEYQYQIRDHLDNVRLTFTAKEKTVQFKATMEDTGEADYSNPRVREMAYFGNLFETEIRNVSQWLNHTSSQIGNAIYLDGSESRTVGPYTILKVYPGDTVRMEAYGKFERKASHNTMPLATILAALVDPASQALNAEAGSVANSSLGDELTPFLATKSSDDDLPSADLNYILFDKNLNIISFDYDRIEQSAGFNPAGEHMVGFDRLFLEKVVDRIGYLYVYVSNESPGSRVWMDDLTVTYIQSPIVQFEDYYPFGLSMEGSAFERGNDRYTGQVTSDGIKELGFRQYDAALGRFHAIDPLAELQIDLSTYQYAGNNPVNQLDVLGLDATDDEHDKPDKPKKPKKRKAQTIEQTSNGKRVKNIVIGYKPTKEKRQQQRQQQRAERKRDREHARQQRGKEREQDKQEKADQGKPNSTASVKTNPWEASENDDIFNVAEGPLFREEDGSEMDNPFSNNTTLGALHKPRYSGSLGYTFSDNTREHNRTTVSAIPLPVLRDNERAQNSTDPERWSYLTRNHSLNEARALLYNAMARGNGYQSIQFKQNMRAVVENSSTASGKESSSPLFVVIIDVIENGVVIDRIIDADATVNKDEPIEITGQIRFEFNLINENGEYIAEYTAVTASEEYAALQPLLDKSRAYGEQFIQPSYSSKDEAIRDIYEAVYETRKYLATHLQSDKDVDNFVGTYAQTKQLEESVRKFREERGIDSKVVIVDREIFEKLKEEYENGELVPDRDVTILMGKNPDGTYEKHIVYKENFFNYPTEKVVTRADGTQETIQLEGTQAEIDAIRDVHIDKAIADNEIEGIGLINDPALNIQTKAMWVIKVTKETLDEVKVPEPIWHKEQYPDDYPFGLQPIVGGVGDGLVDELKSIPDLLMFGLSMFDKEERSKLGDFVQNLSFETIKNMFAEKADKYTNQGPEVAFHEGGYDAVQIASMFWGGAFTKGGKAASTAGEVDGFVDKIDNVLDDVVAQVPEDLKKLSGKTQAKILKELEADPNLLKAVNDNPDIAKAWTQHKPPYPTTDQLERATEALDELDDLTRQKVVDLIEESEQKLTFLTRMGKAKDFDDLVVGQKLADDYGIDNISSQITLKVTSNNGEVREIVADYLVKEGNTYRIVDSKFTQKADFNLEQSLTPNQKDSFDWLRNDQVQFIEVRASPEKLENFPGLNQGDHLDLNNLKVDIYKSKPDLQEIDQITNIY